MKNHEVARLAEPEKKRGRKWLIVFWAAIFWISTLFVIGHPFLFGLQYTIYILPAYIILFNCLRDYKIPVLPYQERIVLYYKKSFIYKLLYVNHAYEKGSDEELTFRQCRGMVYVNLFFALVAFMSIFFDPIKNERKTFYTEGRIVDIKRIPILSFCKNSILTFKKENGEEVKIYAYIDDIGIKLINFNTIYTFEIYFAKRSPVYMCRKYDYLYTLQKDNEIVLGKAKSPEHSKKIAMLASRIGVFFIFVSCMFLIWLCYSYRERNRIQ